MKREKLFYGAAFALLAAALVAALWYKRPLNIRQVTGITEPEEISVTILRRNADMDLEQRDLTLSAGDEGFDTLLARLEEIEFRRPPTNLIRMALPFLPESAETKETEDGDFENLYLLLSAPTESGEWVGGQVSFWVDQWQYRDFDREVTLDLAVTDSKATGQALCAQLWEKAQPIESES